MWYIYHMSTVSRQFQGHSLYLSWRLSLQPKSADFRQQGQNMTKKSTDQGMADYLQQFDESPYTLRPNTRIVFNKGKSPLNGSWCAKSDSALNREDMQNN